MEAGGALGSGVLAVKCKYLPPRGPPRPVWSELIVLKQHLSHTLRPQACGPTQPLLLGPGTPLPSLFTLSWWEEAAVLLVARRMVNLALQLS